MLRFRRNRGPMIPDGTTHVIDHFLPVPDTTGGRGVWELWTLADYLAGTHAADAAGLEGAADASEAEIAAFVVREVGYPVTLTRFEVSIDDGCGNTSTEPAFYVAR